MAWSWVPLWGPCSVWGSKGSDRQHQQPHSSQQSPGKGTENPSGILGKGCGTPQRAGEGGELGSLHPFHPPLHLPDLTLALPHCKQIQRAWE